MARKYGRKRAYETYVQFREREYAENRARTVTTYGAQTLTNFGAELHVTPDGWDVLIVSGPLTGWHYCANGFELAQLATSLVNVSRG